MVNSQNDPEKDKEEIVFDLVKRRYDDELKRINDLDSKAGNLIGYVTIVTGLIVGLGTFDIIAKLSQPVDYILFFGGIGSLVFSIISSFISIRLVSWDIVPEVEDLTSFVDNAFFDSRTVIRQVLSSMSKAVVANEASNNSKTKWITFSWYALIVGLVLLLVYMAVFAVDNVINKKPHSNITSTQQTLQKIYSVDNNTITKLFPLLDVHRYIPFKSIAPASIYPAIGKPWIAIDHEWLDNNITVYITVHSTLKDERTKIVLGAIAEWSRLLKTASHNSSAWNFNVEYLDEKNVTKDIIPPADISVILLDESNYAICSDEYGHSEGIDNDPRYAIIYTSCGENKSSNDEIYTTVLHEFGHAMGLGHAYDKDGDLMCSIDIEDRKTCSILPLIDLIKPSDLDINALLYIYGTDGFGGLNRVISYKPYYLATER